MGSLLVSPFLGLFYKVGVLAREFTNSEIEQRLLSNSDHHSENSQALKIGFQIALLRKLLRWYPRWEYGHLLLGDYSLALEDLSSAYASALAVLALTKRSSIREKALLLLAKCYVRGGSVNKAEPLLKELLSEGDATLHGEVREELAACFVAEERWQETLTLYNSVSENTLSVEIRSALALSRKKIQEHTHE